MKLPWNKCSQTIDPSIGVANRSSGGTDFVGTSTGSREELAPDVATDTDFVGTSTGSRDELVPDAAGATDMTLKVCSQFASNAEE